jgi:two-component system, cell cycle sensor histidine kinase and response regulator CckA
MSDAANASDPTSGAHADLHPDRPNEDLRRQSQKMEALGRLAGGVAHDFNNLLTAINGYADLLLSTLPKTDPNRELAEEIRKAGDKGAGLTRQLLAFSRKQKAEVKSQDMRPIVGDLEKLLARLLPTSIQLECVPCGDASHARVDRGLVEQALINLVVNARDASPQGGIIRIEVVAKHLESWPERSPLKPPSGSFVLVSVTDQGMGMPPEVMAHLFEPFFTTKGRGRGTGLGLSTVYGVMQQLDGGILVESEVGKGSCFTLCFPAAAPDLAQEQALPADYQAPLGNGERIALVESDDAVRRLTRRLLQQAGYTVVELSGYRSIAAASGLDGVVCGVQSEFAQLASALSQSQKWLTQGHARGIVLLGGGGNDLASESASPPKAEAHPKIQWLPKPFAAQDLLLAIRLVLDR